MLQASPQDALENIVFRRVLGPISHKDNFIADRRLVSLGLNGDILRRLANHIPRPLLAATVGTDSSNLFRYYSRQLNSQQTDQLNDLSILWSELRVFFNDDNELLQEWIESNVPALSWDRPCDILSSIAGRKDVHKALEAMRSGDFA